MAEQIGAGIAVAIMVFWPLLLAFSIKIVAMHFGKIFLTKRALIIGFTGVILSWVTAFGYSYFISLQLCSSELLATKFCIIPSQVFVEWYSKLSLVANSVSAAAATILIIYFYAIKTKI